LLCTVLKFGSIPLPPGDLGWEEAGKEEEKLMAVENYGWRGFFLNGKYQMDQTNAGWLLRYRKKKNSSKTRTSDKAS
jgi:hypothetical protein